MTIRIEKTDAGASISFPFALKNDFRNAFPSAKWNASQKVWTVGTRSVKRLKNWAETVETSGLLAELTIDEEIELSAREVETLQSSLTRIKAQILASRKERQSADAYKARAEVLRAELENARSLLENEMAAKQATQTARQEVQDDLEARIAPIVTREQIEYLRRGMASDWGDLKRKNREWFEEKQAEMIQIRRDLAKIGIECRAVTLAAQANFNRPDRDRPDLFVEIAFAVLKRDDED